MFSCQRINNKKTKRRMNVMNTLNININNCDGHGISKRSIRNDDGTKRRSCWSWRMKHNNHIFLFLRFPNWIQFLKLWLDHRHGHAWNTIINSPIDWIACKWCYEFVKIIFFPCSDQQKDFHGRNEIKVMRRACKEMRFSWW